MIEEKIREDIIDDCGPWYWPKLDTGAWDGPLKDWKDSHKTTVNSLKNKRWCVQAGGNCGLYPKLLSKMFDHVVTFEPDPTNFHFLQKNTCDVDENKIIALDAALGDEEKFISMKHLTERNVGMHKIDETPGKISMIRLDKIFIEEHWVFGGADVNVDLIWYDLEGYELKALQGSIETIKTWKPMIGVERASKNIVDFLTELGYNKFSDSAMDTFFKHKEN